jgi:uridine kinase
MDEGSAQIVFALPRAVPRAGVTRVLAIDGRSGAGKTSLAATLADQLDAPIVSLEDLYGGWDGLEHGIELLADAVLEPLAAGRAARVPRYDWVAGEWAEPCLLEPPPVLIVEGVGAGARRAAAFESLIVWLAVPADVRKQRALDRDGGTFAPYWDSWAAQEEAMLARERTPDRADIVIGPPGNQPEPGESGNGLPPVDVLLAGFVFVRVDQPHSDLLEHAHRGRVRRDVGGGANRVRGARGYWIASGANSMTTRAASVIEPESDG